MDDGYEPPSAEYAIALECEANSELEMAQALGAAATEDITERIHSEIAGIESDTDTITGRMLGEVSVALTDAEVQSNAIAARLDRAATELLRVNYNALASIGANPDVSMPYIEATLQANNPVATAIEQFYAPNGVGVDLPEINLPLYVPPGSDIPTGGYGEWYPTDTSATVPPPPLGGYGEYDTPPPSATVPTSGYCPAPVVQCPAPITNIYNNIGPGPGPGGPLGYSTSATNTATDTADSATYLGMIPPPPASGGGGDFGPPASGGAPSQVSSAASVKPTPPTVVPGFGSWSQLSRCTDIVGAGSGPLTGAAFPAAVGDMVKYVLGSIAGDKPTGSGIGASIQTGIYDLITGLAEGGSELAKVLTAVLLEGTGLDSIREGTIVATAMPVLGVAQWAERITGMPVGHLTQGVTYDLQWASPQLLPSQPECDDLYTLGRINDELWECWTRANNNIPEHRRYVRDSRNTRPDVREEVVLQMRGWQDADDLASQLRRLGVTDQRDISAYRELLKFVPGPADLIRFMVRDSFDAEAVRDNGYMEGFAAKFAANPEAQAMAKAQGVSEDAMKLFWASHWNIPSYTQLSEMLHRLRPGRTPEGVEAVTSESVKKALQVDDMAPAWVERMMAISYNTITRTDLLQWYVNGTITPADVIERLKDTGYSDADAREIQRNWAYEVTNRKANRARTWTRDKIVKSYIEGVLNRRDAQALLEKTIPDAVEVLDILDEADLVRLTQQRGKCIRSWRARYFKGEYTLPEIKRQLALLGMDAQQIDDLGDGWQCELTARSKVQSLTVLSRWFRRGLITIEGIRTRLLNLQYSAADAEHAVSNMVLTEGERRDNVARAALKERISESLRRQRLSRQAQKDFEQEIQDLDRLAEKQAKAAKEARRELQAAVTKAEKAREKAAKEAQKAAAKAAQQNAAGLPEAAPAPAPVDTPDASDTDAIPPETEIEDDQPAESNGE